MEHNRLQKFEAAFFPITFQNLVLFAFIWLLTGFTTGTATLTGPVRWVANWVRGAGWSAGTEDWLVRFIMVVYVAASFLLALWLTRGILRSRLKHVKIGIPALAILFTLGCLYFWLNPQMFSKQVSKPEESVGEFTFGPYPTVAKMQELKQQGYTAIISLLHPAVVPFEPKLLAEEKANAKQVGIPIIHLPMLPWVSENVPALDSVKALALRHQGKYYVHCYLGRDRVGAVRKVIEHLPVHARVASSGLPENRWSLKNTAMLERGKVVQLDSNLYLTPYPTDEEYFAYIIAGDIRQVVSLLDPQNPDDVPWIEKERQTLQKYGIPFRLLPVSVRNYNPDSVLAVAHRLHFIPRPAVAHGFLARGARWEAVIQAYRSNRPPLPPSLFLLPIKNGNVQVVAPNIAIGPRPDGPEFGGELWRRGIRKYLCLSTTVNADIRLDSVVTHRHGIWWQRFHGRSAELLKILASDGPWYLYGPDVAKFRPIIEHDFGPAIPPKITFDPRELQRETPVEISGQPVSRLLPGYLMDFYHRGVPSLFYLIILSPIFVLYAALAGALSGWLRMTKKVRTPYTRKVFHLFIFTLASVLQFTLGLSAVILYGTIVALAVLYAVYRGDGFPFYEAMARPTDAPHRTLFILIPLLTTALGGVLANIFFAQFAYIGYLVGGWGDAVGEPVGARWGKHKYRVPSLAGVMATRSLEGSAAVVLVGALVAFVGLLAGGYPLAKVIYVALAAAVSGALVEAVSNHGLDNLTIQVTAAAVVSLMLG